MRTLKILVSLGIIFSLVLVSFAFAEEQKPEKKYDARFSLAGGSVRGNFALNGEFTYARNFSGLFAQVSTMVNTCNSISEYGMSFGMGAQGEVVQAYLFVDGLYREKLWAQVRPVIRLDFDWLSIGGYYAYPLQSSPLQIGYRTISAAKYFGVECSLVPLSWVRLYGLLNSVEGLSESYRLGIEIRPLKFIAISTDWNKSAGYSNWNRFGGLRFALNLLLGAGQNGFRQTKKTGPAVIPTLYPTLLARSQSGKIIDDDGDGDGDDDGVVTFATNVEISYQRVDPYKSTDYYDSNVSLEVNPPNLFQGWQAIWNALMTKVTEKEFKYVAASLPYETKLWMVVRDPGRSFAGGPSFNGKRFKVSGQELDDRFVQQTDPVGNNRECARFIIKKDNSVIPW